MPIQPKPLNKSRTPATANAWQTLAVLAIQRAEKLGDRRAFGLKIALNQGQVEKTLRLMGIICEADLQREFPT